MKTLLLISSIILSSCVAEPPDYQLEVTVIYCDDRPNKLVRIPPEEVHCGCGLEINNKGAVPQWKNELNVCELKVDTLRTNEVYSNEPRV